MGDGRRIPVGLIPLPGESLDGWLLSYANYIDTSVKGLVAQAGISPGNIPSNCRRLAIGDWLPDLSDLEFVVGTGPGALVGLTLSTRWYDGPRDAAWSVVQPPGGSYGLQPILSRMLGGDWRSLAGVVAHGMEHCLPRS